MGLSICHWPYVPTPFPFLFPSGGLTDRTLLIWTCVLPCMPIQVVACPLEKGCASAVPPSRSSRPAALLNPNSLLPTTSCQSSFRLITFSKHNKAMVLKTPSFIRRTKVQFYSRGTVTSQTAREPSISIVNSTLSPTASIWRISPSSIVQQERWSETSSLQNPFKESSSINSEHSSWTWRSDTRILCIAGVCWNKHLFYPWLKSLGSLSVLKNTHDSTISVIQTFYHEDYYTLLYCTNSHFNRILSISKRSLQWSSPIFHFYSII